MRKLLLLVLSSALLVACSDPNGVAFDPGAQFDAFWHTYDVTYPYFALKQVDWTATREQFRPRAAAAVDEAGLVDVLRDAVAPLRDVHIWFTTPAGQLQSSYQATSFRNWDRDVWLQYVTASHYVFEQTNWGHALMGGIPYIAFGAWNTAQIHIEAVDAALEPFRNSPGMIIDVRMNGGGSDALAFQVAGRFTSARRLADYVAFRDGPGHSDLGEPEARYVDPRGAWQFTRPVVLLVGRGVFSSNESFVSAMREFPNVTVIGDTTGGGSGNPKDVSLGGGWKYSVPRWFAYTADRQIVEWQGIAPDIVVPTSDADFRQGRDVVLEYALAFMRARVGAEAGVTRGR